MVFDIQRLLLVVAAAFFGSNTVKAQSVSTPYEVKTCVVLWDNDWPKPTAKHWEKPGRVFYLKPDDIKVVDTWRL